MDPAYKTALILWVKDLAETAVFGALAWPVARRLVKKYLGELRCPHCGQKFGTREAIQRKEKNDGEVQTVGETSATEGR